MYDIGQRICKGKSDSVYLSHLIPVFSLSATKEDYCGYAAQSDQSGGKDYGDHDHFYPPPE